MREVQDAKADLMLNSGVPTAIPREFVARFRADPDLGTIHINEIDLIGGIMIEPGDATLR